MTDDGMVIDVRFLQLLKALDPIDVRFGGIFTVSKLIHPENVFCPIEEIFDGIVMDVNDEHP